MENSKEIDLLIRTSSFNKPNVPVILTEGILTFGNSEIRIENVTGLKYGTEAIQFEMFRVGRKYIIDMESETKELSILFKSYFGLHNSYFSNLYSSIINNIWNDITMKLVNQFSDQLLEGKEFSIGKCRITQEGVFIDGYLTNWQDLSFQRNYDRLTLNNKSNPKIWTNLYYTKTYNVDVLAAIIDWVINKNGLLEISTQ